MRENLLGERPVERADAAANRRRILAAAEDLFAMYGQQVTMAQLAAAAGVGRGTLYRRYESVAAVAVALLDEHERELQSRILSGPPPLGPGASPHDRLNAFFDAMVDLLERHLPLALGAEIGASRYATGAYGFWRTHVHTLLTEAGVTDPALADILLAPLAPDHFQHLRTTRHCSTRTIKSSLHHLSGLVRKSPSSSQ
ncbi:TetR/AcrR family transcriptional regulator [Dactylosporangium fulvum]|uniref:TetR/AcrR family transcriptional regulator n=1 Tax=Dactylosporangium fulvum TaxID=53359 RepID=A0ABY5W8W2_9ACTN|nr:TetR/AcrR family transcriptional regulator [Dactylosporangium fulvum]UWP86463.1 TetR/AcrR family transcriptional regulator [Dactylosporangium fulvum]